MKTKVEDLQAGCILNEDIMGLTQYPLIRKETVLTEKHIEVLKAFFITDVKLKLKLGDRTLTKQAALLAKNERLDDPASSFHIKYKKAVDMYQQEFKNWQSGAPVDIAAVRKLVLPIAEEAIKDITIIYSLSQQANKKDYVAHHAISTGIISGMLAKKLGLEQGRYVQAVLAGCLMDCGMAKMPEKWLNQAQELTTEVYTEVKKHPALSYQMVKASPFLTTDTKLAIYQHQERLDGSGYPEGLKADQIHDLAKVIAVADAYYTMNQEQSPFRVIQQLFEDHFGKFDFIVLRALSSLIANFKQGTQLKLSNGEQAEVLFVKAEALTRPLVKVCRTKEMINLEEKRDLFIEQIIL